MPNYSQSALSLFLLTSLLIGCSAPSSSIQTAIAQTQMALPTSIPVLPSTPVPTPTQILPPATNSIYFGTAEGKNTIFVTSHHQWDYYKNLGFESSPFLGKLYYGVGYQNDVYNFHGLVNPQLLFTIPDLNQWDEVKYDLDRLDRKYISGTRNAPPNLVSFVYVVNLDTGKYQDIWTWTGFPAHIRYVYNEYLEISISWCYACDYVATPKTIILNTLSGKTLELGEVGNVNLDLDKGTVSFQNLIPIETICEDDTPCIGTRYEPSGEIFMKSLP